MIDAIVAVLGYSRQGVGDLGQSIERIVIEAGDGVVGRYRIVPLRLRLEFAVVVVGVAGNRGIGGVQLGGEAATQLFSKYRVRARRLQIAFVSDLPQARDHVLARFRCRQFGCAH